VLGKFKFNNAMANHIVDLRRICSFLNVQYYYDLWVAPLSF